jgi:C4-dicarboxylate-specific signal transduction histidine kinase
VRAKVSVRQLVVLYVTLFMFLITAAVVTLAGTSLVSVSRRAYRHAVADELIAVASQANAATVRKRLEAHPKRGELEIGVVTATISVFGVTLEAAREAARTSSAYGSLVSEPILGLTVDQPEAYVVALIDPSIPFTLGIVELTRKVIPLALLVALGCAAVLSLMIGRLLIPALSSLRDIARDPNIRADGLVSDDAPNEIFEVAQTFRRTLRQLKEEREFIEAQHKELEKMQASLVRAEKLASVGRLAAGIAHEIGNPLAAVQGYLALLPRLDDSERKEVVERSAKELQRIHETIKKLLTYARQDEAVEPMAPMAFAQVARDSVLLVRGHPSMRRVEVKEELGPIEEKDALGHAGRLGQVLVNLLLNAAHAMEGTEAPQIAISRRVDGQFIELLVTDNGPGIPPDKLEEVFDPFYTTKAPGEGTGLGLAVSRSLVEGMSGDLTAHASPQGGALFVVRLRRPQGQAERAAERSEAKSQG